MRAAYMSMAGSIGNLRTAEKYWCPIIGYDGEEGKSQVVP